MENIKKTSDVVYEILKHVPSARNSDNELYLRTCLAYNCMVSSFPFGKVMMERKELGIPPYESVRRARQKLQSQFPELAGTAEVEEARSRLSDKVKEWAVDGI